jgi:hypothetical protein
VPMPGDPGAVESGANQLTAMAEGFTSAGEGIRLNVTTTVTN